MIQDLPSYPKIVEAVRNGARFLDVGTCFGQDLRKLVSEGVPIDNIYSLEKEQGFLDASFDFFGDRDRPPAHFILGNLLDKNSPDIQALEGTVDIIHISMVLHIWDWEGQIQVCQRLIKLLKPEKGVLIVGRLVGRLEPCVWLGPHGRSMYKHNPDSFEKLWKELGELTGTQWVVRAFLQGKLGVPGVAQEHFDDPPTRRMMFEVERL
jgi:hypothetical protein